MMRKSLKAKHSRLKTNVSLALAFLAGVNMLREMLARWHTLALSPVSQRPSKSYTAACTCHSP